MITAAITVVWMYQIPDEVVPYTLSKTTMSGLPNFTFPSMQIVTPDKTYNFIDILAELNLGIIVIPIVGMLTNISIGKLSKFADTALLNPNNPTDF